MANEPNPKPDETTGNVTNKSGEQNPPPGQSSGELPDTSGNSGEPKPKKIELTEEELEARAAARAAEIISKAEEEARRREAEAQGNYKVLFEESEAARKKAELSSWRTKALQKYNLSDKWFDALTGETEEEIGRAAKKIRTQIDDEISAREAVLRDDNVPPPPRRNNPPRNEKQSSEDYTRNQLTGALDLGRFKQVANGNR